MEEVQKIEELTMKLEKSMAPKIEALEEMSEKEMAKLDFKVDLESRLSWNKNNILQGLLPLRNFYSFRNRIPNDL